MRQQGFTLIEFLIVLTIIAILVSIGSFAGYDFYKSYALNAERDVLVSSLIKARNQAVNNLNESPHGVFIDSNGYTLFEGSSYASRDPAYDELIKSNSLMTLTGLEEIVFDQLTGNLTTLEGNIDLSNGTRSAVISLNNEGRIEW
jgi:prepilin-type N-terminal cleavage/methylation domain-containing protein